jgi:heavy metal sensor kinase
MNSWWQRRSFKMRLALWYAIVMSLVLAGFALAVYEIVEHRLEAELDRQLRIDFDLIEAQLEIDESGAVRWMVRGAHGDEGFARLSAWFEVWSEDRALLLRHWPVADSNNASAHPPTRAASLSFRDTELEQDVIARVMERPARLGQRGIVVRVFRDQSPMRQTLRQIVEVFAVTLPFAVALASLGGYFLARRSLKPVAAMAAEAKHITSQSLQARLPNINPHDEFGQLATVINDTLGRLENSFSELKRFTADASHELRTPLTALRTVGEVALRKPTDVDSLREAIESMLEEAQRLSELAESLLTLARMESGGAPVQQLTVDLSALVSDVRESLTLLATDKRQRLEMQCEPGIVVSGDETLLRQALLNVVHNAIRYSPPDSLVNLTLTRRRSDAVIEIADQGPGIDVQYHEKIFERFFRINSSRSRTDGGHGLGLSIAKWSVERQGGRIELQSKAGGGTTFRLYLPIP